MDYRSIIESKYNRANWQGLLYDIFRQRVQFWQQPQLVPVDESMAKRALYTGKITLPDGHIIAIYEVELSDSVVIERNRAGIRNLLCTNWRGMGCSGAFMFCFRQNEAVLRFSYVSESFVFAEDGSLTKESTDTKRFTYLLGEGHRSRTAIKQFEDLKKSALNLKAITKAFSVEALSDLFFKEYKKQYEDIIEFITGKRMVKVNNKWEEQTTCQPCREIMQEFSQFPDAEKAVRDYVKKLMGRLVFIQFLQKKGWMGCSAGEAWNDGDKEFVQNLFANTSHKNTFVDDVLEPLFNDINTKRNGDITSSQNVGNGIKIPYLNGGLFEKDDYDKTNFPLPAKYMKNLLDFFASYNFTIDENDPDDAEIGVDPEMLGRIFENLLEDNKDKGAFYTPKEIVQYMCRESLIAYLQTDVNDEQIKDSIRQFVTTYDDSVLSVDLKETVDQKLKDVKICDPAIGSGAFPMGLLRELYACRKAIEGIDDETAVSIKTHIIQNNIYGVDIEKGAVDIARLRFWLALIVDEKNPHALPNMDFKIMQGNSLLEQYEGVELSGMSLDEQKKRKAKKGQAWQATLAFDEKYALDNIQHAIKEYYLTDDHNTKLSLRSIINENVRSYIINLKGCTPDVQRKIEKLPIPNDKFFLWHIYFKEVFDNGGFDIVLANPPYKIVKSTNTNKYELNIYKKFESADFKINLFALFYELGINIANSKGVVSFIIPDTILNLPAFTKCRTFILNYSNLHSVSIFEEDIFENATVGKSVIVNSQLGVYKNDFKYTEFKTWNDKTTKEVAIANVMSDTEHKFIDLSDSNDNMLVKKIRKYSHTLSDYCDIYDGMNPGSEYIKNKLFTFERIDNFSKPTIDGKDFDRYSTISWNGLYVYYNETYINEIRKQLASEGTAFTARIIKKVNYFEVPKIVTRQTADSIIGTFDNTGYYTKNSVHSTIIKHQFANKLPIEFVLANMNSKLINWLYRIESNEGGRVFPQVKINRLRELPIIIPSEDKIAKITSYVKELLLATDETKRNELQKAIDISIYQVYDLSPEEIKIIDPNND